MSELVLDPTVGSADNTNTQAAPGNTDPVLKPDNSTDNKAQDSEADKAKLGAPEKYDLKMPENFQADKERIAAFEGWARQNNLSQEAVQAVFDMYVKEGQDAAKAQADYFNQITDQWFKEAQEAKDIGGQNWETTKTNANKAMKVFGTNEAREALDAAGLGVNQHIIRLLSKVGAALRDDKTHPGNSSQQQAAKSAAEKMFPNQNK